MNKPLAPCPNPECGRTEAHVMWSGGEPAQGIKGAYHYWILCPVCCTCGPKCRNEPEAARLWDALPRVAAVERHGGSEQGRTWYSVDGRNYCSTHGRLRMLQEYLDMADVPKMIAALTAALRDAAALADSKEGNDVTP